MTYEHTTYRDATLRAVPALGAILVVLFAVVRRRALLNARGAVPGNETTTGRFSHTTLTLFEQ